MQRQFCVKLLSKIAGNASRINTNSVFPKSVSATSFLKSDVNPVYRQSLSRHSTLPRCDIWKFCSRNRVSGRIPNGFSWSLVLSRRSFSNALLNGKSKFPVHGNAPRSCHSNTWLIDKDLVQTELCFTESGSGGIESDDELVLCLIAMNVSVYMLWKVAGSQFMVNHFMISVDNFSCGQWHTLITSAFSHRDGWHLISNMVGLYFFGTSIGRSFGPEYMLKLYLSGAFVGSIFYLAYHAFIAPLSQSKQMPGIDPSRVPGLGASGAVNAIMLLDIFLFPSKTLYFDFIIPVPAILLGVYITGKDLLGILKGDGEVSGSVYFGGATVAALAWLQRRRRRIRFGRF